MTPVLPLSAAIVAGGDVWVMLSPSTTWLTCRLKDCQAFWHVIIIIYWHVSWRASTPFKRGHCAGQQDKGRMLLPRAPPAGRGPRNGSMVCTRERHRHVRRAG